MDRDYNNDRFFDVPVSRAGTSYVTHIRAKSAELARLDVIRENSEATVGEPVEITEDEFEAGAREFIGSYDDF